MKRLRVGRRKPQRSWKETRRSQHWSRELSIKQASRRRETLIALAARLENDIF